VSLKTVFTVCVGALFICGSVFFLARTGVALTLSVTALMIAIALHHVVDFLLARGMRRNRAIILVVATAFVVVLALGFTIIPPAIDQANEFALALPRLVRSARGSSLFLTLDTRMHLSARLADFESHVPSLLEGAAAPLLSVLGGVLSGVGAAITVVVLALFMLVFGERLLKQMLSEALPTRQPMYRKVLSKIYRSVGGYLGGILLICSLNAVFTILLLAILRVPFFLPLGILSGFSSLVPYVGPLVCGSLISVIAAVTGGLWQGLGCVIYFVIYGQIEGNVIAPFIFRRTAHVNPLVVALSILFFGEFAGVFGAILAVPAAAAAQIILREILRERRERLHLPPLSSDGSEHPPPVSIR
jgi:predicted PurR-regulated permease PerM